MKGYIRYIKYDLIFIAFLLAAMFLLSGIKKAGTDRAERMNAECVTQERVFDYADKLTDAQEEKLRKLIAKREKQIQADIVIVTLDEQMTDYDVMVYSDDLQDSWKFGYNEPYGNCAMLVLAGNGVELQPEFELSTSDMIVQFALRNLGIGCVVRDFAEEALESGKLFELRFNKMIPKRQICVVTRRNRPLPVAAGRLLDIMWNRPLFPGQGDR